MKRALIYDTETTKLSPPSLAPLKEHPKVIEFYGCVVDLDVGDVIEELEFLCHPGEKIDKKITEITSITNEMLEGKPPFREYAPAVRKLIETSTAVAAHNLSYDYGVINAEFLRIGTAPIIWPDIRICTVEVTEHFKGFRLNLSGLHEHLFGQPFAGAHRARVDVEALARCCVELRKRGVI